MAPIGSVNNNKNDIILERKITRKVLIRHIKDIGNLLTTDYGLPVISNFPLIDAVIQPNYLIQVTESITYKRAVGKLNDIRSQLNERDLKKHAMVFVLNVKNYEKYHFIEFNSKLTII